MLYHLLPVVFWLLAVVGSVTPFFVFSLPANYAWGYVVVALVLTCIVVLGRIQRHVIAIEECFQVAVLIGVASYWVPTVLFLMVPIWGFLIIRNHFSFRSFMATLIGFALVAIWAAIFIYLGWITNPWADFFANEYAWGWSPTGSFLLAWLASTIAHHVFKVR